MSRDFKPLSKEQLQAAEHLGGPLLIAAGAGSGKTHTLTSRLLHLLKSGIKPENIIAITFTNKAAKEMRNRVDKFKSLKVDKSKNNEPTNLKTYELKNLFIGTFHSMGVRILKEEARSVNRTEYFTIFDEDDSLSLIKDILKEFNLSKDSFNPIKIANKISHFKNEVLDPGELDTENNLNKIFLSIFKKYEATLLKSNAFDFDDLIEKVVRIFSFKPKILEKYQTRWQYILVDEFQDVNTSQYLLVKLLAKKHQNLFVIGDDAQSIYSFRGSDFRNFLNFENDWPQAKTIKLEENYRSTQNIIKAASQLIKNNKFQKPKDLWTKNSTGSLIKVTSFSNKEEEAWGITEKIKELLDAGKSLKDIAILYRTNAQSRALEQALIQNNVPYEIFGGLKFYHRKEIKDIVAGLRYAFNPKDSVSINRLVKNFKKGQSELLLQELPRLAEKLSLTELIKFFLENTDYFSYLEKHFKNPEERRENIKELIEFASAFTDPQEFLEKASLMTNLDGRPKLQENAVKLMTIHLAKGLEFSHIFIVGAIEGILPHERSMLNNDDLEEERRLMYVAMTRAKENLHLSFYDLPSRFLGELPPELIDFKQVTSYGEQTKDWDDEAIYIE